MVRTAYLAFRRNGRVDDGWNFTSTTWKLVQQQRDLHSLQITTAQRYSAYRDNARQRQIRIKNQTVAPVYINLSHVRGDNKSGVGGISNRQPKVSFPPQRQKSTTSTKPGAYVWREKNWPIGRWTVLQSRGESPKPSAMAAAKNLKDSDFVTCVRRREDLKSAKESSHPSGTAEENMVNGSDLKLEISRKNT